MTSEHDSEFSPVARKFMRASESLIGARKPDCPPFCLFSLRPARLALKCGHRVWARKQIIDQDMLNTKNKDEDNSVYEWFVSILLVKYASLRVKFGANITKYQWNS